ncbi:MAG: hypothetical protein ACE5KO_06545 [Candidatus Bathyarchaeia archaeon]
MSKLAIEKPFWMKPPWLVLFDLIKLYKVRPWDVNIAHLLSSFITEMKSKGYVDFAVSGTALLSSAIVFRLKSELIMQLEEPPKPPVPKPEVYIPPALQLPIRFELTSTTIDSLIEAFEEAARAGLEERIPKTPSIPPPPDFFSHYEQFFVEIEARMRDLYNELLKIHGGRSISFSRLAKGKATIEVFRLFLLLLFLANRDMITLIQEHEFGEIRVHLPKGVGSGGPKLTV